MRTTGDPVRMYLREMGTVPLLSRDGEVEIDRRIEHGEWLVYEALYQNPAVLRELLRLKELGFDGKLSFGDPEGASESALEDGVKKRIEENDPISLETPIGEKEDSHLRDFIEDKRAISPVEAVLAANLKEQTSSVLNSLSSREELVLRMRFGVGEGSEHTLEEVGRSFNVTRERIRQIESKALSKLRDPNRSTKLLQFFDLPHPETHT